MINKSESSSHTFSLPWMNALKVRALTTVMGGLLAAHIVVLGLTPYASGHESKDIHQHPHNVSSVQNKTLAQTSHLAQAREKDAKRPLNLPDATLLDPQDQDLNAQEKQAQIYQMLALLGEIFTRIDDRYVSDVNQKALLEGAIRGMLGTLDPYSSYLDTKNYEALRDATSGEYSGIGARIGRSQENETLVEVVEIFIDSPSERSGLRVGDVIVKVDGDNVLGKSVSEVTDRLLGDIDTEVDIVVRRKNPITQATTEVDIMIKRGNIQGHVVSIRRYNNIGYLRLHSFSRNAADQLTKGIDRLKSYTSTSLDSYILDLRNNPGGLLDEALKVSDVFLDGGEIVTIRNERNNSDQTIQRFYAQPGDAIDGRDLTILINGYTASASEIVAGALGDQERADTVGVKSFGKGAVQDIIDIGPQVGMAFNQVALKLTTRRYFTPSGKSIDHIGINPDYEIINTTDRESSENTTSDQDNQKDQKDQQSKNLSLLNAPSPAVTIKYSFLPSSVSQDPQLAFALQHLGYKAP